ncbi:hypothetical protein HRE53_15735 [Acaryochloris sp. 'Moss Beach']|uniref:beta strand repeat-containing protein n=1 Tax=Acaryochloris TaxID=155977 RepID=UPI001BB00201|nr:MULTISPECIES: hypothetical protein [Acaryochloris]QUY43206.1 hypothetical protein I1H34_03345 [Acaryochloris marina S15]UJB68058.1 hypothetical protein HRE53_15735 [Acaryochloris sp. 'Moss Beach']
MKTHFGLKTIAGSTLGLMLVFSAFGQSGLAQTTEVEEGAIYTGDITLDGNENAVDIETLDNDCGTNFDQRDDDGTDGTSNNIDIQAGEDALEGIGTGCANASSSSVGNSSDNTNTTTINASPDNTSTSEAITSGAATSSVEGGYSQSQSNVSGGDSNSFAEGATGGSSTSQADLGNVSRGDTTLGNTTRGDTTLGNTTRGDTTLGNTTRGNTALGDVSRGDTTLGNNDFNAATTGGSANQDQSANTNGGNVTGGSANQDQSANTNGGNVTGGSANSTGGSANTLGGNVNTTGGSADQNAVTNGGSATQDQNAATNSGEALTNSGNVSVAPITIDTRDSSVDNSAVTNNHVNISNQSSFNRNSVFNDNSFSGRVSGGFYARANASTQNSSAYGNDFSSTAAEVEVGVFKVFQTAARRDAADRAEMKFAQNMIVYCTDFLKHYPNLMTIDVATITDASVRETVQSCQDLGPMVTRPQQVIINVPPQAQPLPQSQVLPGSRQVPDLPRSITRSSGG